MAYDVFISYRRATGVDDARLLQQALKARGYDVFFDYASLRDGKFNEKIFESIDSAPVFILMMTEHSLDKCAAEGDWVRMEIERAIGKGRKIILVAPTSRKWSFPDNLPDSLRNIQDEQVSPMDKASLFEESIDKIINDRFPDELKRKRRSSQNTPCTVTNPSNVFFGRDAELASLHALLAAGKAPVVTGPGGTGKSELAFQYAKRYRADYPGGLFQIDMETVKSWDEAFQRLLSSPGANIRSLLDLPRNYDDDGTNARRKEFSTAEIARALKRRVGQTGRTLLVLDNVESPKALFAELVLAKLSLLPEVSIVATARTYNANLRSTDSAAEFRLEDLSPDAALAVLLADRPEADADERKAAGRVAELLGYRALYLRRVPALIGDLYAQTVCDSYVELARALEENLLGTVAEETEGTHLPDVLWNMTRERLLKMPLGAECVKLVQVASFFSPEGFPQHILKHLWKTVVAPNLDEKSFTRALEILKHHNVLQSIDPVRIHCLDRAAILQTTTDVSRIEDVIGKELALYEGMSPKYWLLLVDHNAILRFVPEMVRFSRNDDSISLQTFFLCQNIEFQNECQWDKLKGSDWVYLLNSRPKFASRCPWNKLCGDDWVHLLSEQPQFADKCPWDSLAGEHWETLLSLQPQFANRCPWEWLDGNNWAGLLESQPQFADRCQWNKFDGGAWVRLLKSQPQFADRCQWKKFDDISGWDWGGLLAKQPQFASRCPWNKLDGRDWALLLESQPQFADRCQWQKLDVSSGGLWLSLLAKQPQFANRCPWGKLDCTGCFDGEYLADLLEAQPQFINHIPWNKFDGSVWANLLEVQPRFASRCPWDKLNGWLWASLLSKQPQFANRCPWDKFDGGAWLYLLESQPQFVDLCPWDSLGNYFDYSAYWVNLLRVQPQFANRCPWNALELDRIAELLASQPQFVGYCSWEKLLNLEGEDWALLLTSQPQFADHCPWANLSGYDWAWLLFDQPKFACICPWDKFDGSDWVTLLKRRPQFASCCAWEKLNDEDWDCLLESQPQFIDYRHQK